MPHKKNPDVFELLRARCNKLTDMPQQIAYITGNLPSGYFRDMQIIKEIFIPAFDELISCLDIMTLALQRMEVVHNIMDNEMYKYAFSVEEVNRRVLKGVPFRDAYKQVGLEIEAGKFSPDTSRVKHTHEGSIGNLCNDKIREKMNAVMLGFSFGKVEAAIEKLIT
jgi:argininosuccinate lyase